MSLKLEIIDPTRYEDWDDIVLSVPGFTFFHSSAWAKVLSESYNCTPVYFMPFRQGKLVAVMPFMEVKSILTGRRGVSLPFTDYSDPIMVDDIQLKDILKPVMDLGKKFKWKYLELRGNGSLLHDASPSVSYLGHILDLSETEERLLSSC